MFSMNMLNVLFMLFELHLTSVCGSIRFCVAFDICGGNIRFYVTICLVYFCGGRGLNPGPCIYYALSLPTELKLTRTQSV